MDHEGRRARRGAVSRWSNASLATISLLLVTGAVGLVYWRSRPTQQPPPAPAVAPPAQPIAQIAAIDAGEPQPSRPDIDPATALRQAAAGLSRRAEWARWLLEPRLISRLAAAVNRVAEGESPRPLLLFLAPAAPFTTVSREGKLFATPEDSARYDLAVKVVTAVDLLRAARAYDRLQPLFQAALREIARPGARFTAVLHRAIHELLATPVPATEPELVERGAVTRYAEPGLERLAPAQKQLLRLGGANARALQRWLAALDRALPAN